MNKKRILFAMIAICIFAVGPIVRAATPKPLPQNIDTTINIDGEQVVQVLPEGGFIYNTTGSSSFNSEFVESNGGVLMTYNDYLEKESQNKPPITQFRAASPSIAEQTPKTLAHYETYVSSLFTNNNGWRFGEVKFRADPKTGHWLLWNSRGDSGRVGTVVDARRTYQNGGQYGTAIGKNEWKYVNTEGDWQIYYTFRPAMNSGYIVANE